MRPPPLMAGLELVALNAFALAQPTFVVVSDTPEFFPLRDATGIQVILFALSMVVVLPALVLVIEELVGRFSQAWRLRVHVAMVGFLGALVALQWIGDVAEVTDRIPGEAVVGIAGLAGVGLSIAYVRVRAVRTYLRVASAATALFLFLFLVRAPLGSADLPRGTGSARPVPVVMVVFDEFPVASLMDARERIDRRRYPNFAELARHATWYRNTTTVADDTPAAVPALLTGDLPRQGAEPLPSEYPVNIFSLLRKTHRVRAREAYTRLCPNHCRPIGLRRLPGQTARNYADGLEVAVHGAAPPDLEHLLGRLDEGVQLGDAAAPFAPFGRGLQRSRTPSLDFLHVLLPHHPWFRLPTGQIYEHDGPQDIPAGFRAGNEQRWGSDDWLVKQAWQRHLLQTRYVDRLLGRLLARLRRTGLYDRALLVVVADHGVSFRARHPMRDVSPSNVEDIARVPLFIKAPRQRRGRVSDLPARTVDVLPTVADYLGIRFGRSVAGRPLEKGPTKESGVVEVSALHGNPVRVSRGALNRRFARALRRRIAIFGTGTARGDVYRLGPRPDLVGRRAGAVGRAGGIPVAISVDQAKALAHVSRTARFVPALLTGRVLTAHTPTGRSLAVVVNGRVGGVVPLRRNGTRLAFSVVIPAQLLRDGANRVRGFVVRG